MICSWCRLIAALLNGACHMRREVVDKMSSLLFFRSGREWQDCRIEAAADTTDHRRWIQEVLASLPMRSRSGRNNAVLQKKRWALFMQHAMTHLWKSFRGCHLVKVAQYPRGTTLVHEAGEEARHFDLPYKRISWLTITSHAPFYLFFWFRAHQNQGFESLAPIFCARRNRGNVCNEGNTRPPGHSAHSIFHRPLLYRYTIFFRFPFYPAQWRSTNQSTIPAVDRIVTI